MELLSSTHIFNLRQVRSSGC